MTPTLTAFEALLMKAKEWRATCAFAGLLRKLASHMPSAFFR